MTSTLAGCFPPHCKTSRGCVLRVCKQLHLMLHGWKAAPGKTVGDKLSLHTTARTGWGAEPQEAQS